MNDHDDDKLAELMGKLDVPDYPDPQFFANLTTQLEAEDARRGDALNPARSRPARPGRWSARGWRVAVPIVAIATALTVATSLLPEDRDGSSRIAPDVASAASVVRTVQRSYARARSVSGAYQWSFRQSPSEPLVQEEAIRFVVLADGSWRLDSGNGGTEVSTQAYDARSLTETSHFRSSEEGGFEYVVVRSGLPLAAPDRPAMSIPRRDLGDVVRAMVGARDGDLRIERLDGRKVWTVTFAVDEPGSAGVTPIDELVVSVDQETGLPVRLVERSQGRTMGSLAISNLRVDAPLEPDTFRPAYPGVRREQGQGAGDFGFRRAAAADVQKTLGYEAIEAGWLPDGFIASDTVVARRPTPSGEEGTLPARDVAQHVYRRGLDEIVVTTRRVSPTSGAAPSPYPTGGGGDGGSATSFTPERGLLADGPVQVSAADPQTGVHAWGSYEGLVVTVAGSVSRAELERVIEGLRTGAARE